jgi:hypothetical protein
MGKGVFRRGKNCLSADIEKDLDEAAKWERSYLQQ